MIHIILNLLIAAVHGDLTFEMIAKLPQWLRSNAAVQKIWNDLKPKKYLEIHLPFNRDLEIHLPFNRDEQIDTQREFLIAMVSAMKPDLQFRVLQHVLGIQRVVPREFYGRCTAGKTCIRNEYLAFQDANGFFYCSLQCVMHDAKPFITKCTNESMRGGGFRSVVKYSGTEDASRLARLFVCYLKRGYNAEKHPLQQRLR